LNDGSFPSKNGQPQSRLHLNGNQDFNEHAADNSALLLDMFVHHEERSKKSTWYGQRHV
jgi:hypothetical protein